ncbi:Ig-like domain-containing protein, partial [Maritimibacter sp. UBA3975]|uniref:Ig-like domain-containing protein n=1 Tax=Maritimibacter sp. UBA3975 TaxID=1946833 RepID=UPI0025BE245C
KGADGRHLSLDTTGTTGTVVLNGGGIFYTPDAAANALALGESLVDTFSYAITDGNGGQDTATVSITVTGANDAPDAQDDAFTGGQAGLGGNVLADNGSGADSDPDTSDTLEVVAVNGLASQVGQELIILSGQTVRLEADGTFVLNGNGQFDGLGAGESFAGTILTYTISDGNGGTDSGSISVEVFGENDAPNAVDDAYTTAESEGFVADVFRPGDPDADSDPDGDAFNVVALNGATGTTQVLASGAVITLVSAATGQISYDPNGAFEGLLDGETIEDSFTYTIADGAGATDTATVTVEVVGENDAPVAADDSNAGDPVIEAGVTEPGDDIATGNVLTNDSDVDATGPLVVTFADSGTGAPGSAMPVSSGATQVILGSYGALLMDADGTWTYDLDDLDPDTDALDAGEVGVETFTYTVSDGLGGTDTAVLTIDIQGSSDDTAPNAVDDAISVNEDASVSFDPRGNDSDDQGDPISLVSVGAASNGSVVIDDKGTATTADDEIVYTPDADYAGTDSFTYTISDGQFTSTATVSVDVEAVADTPTVSIGLPPVLNDLTPSAWPGFGDKTADIGLLGFQSGADVTALKDGGFMLTWTTTPTISNSTPVYLYTQEYSADGVAVTPFTLIPPQFAYPSYGPLQVGHDTVQLSNGTKVFGWAESSSASTDGIHVRMETSGGGVSTQTLYTSGSLPASGVEIAELDDGGFVVTFVAPLAPSGWALYAQRFDEAGVAQNGLTAIYTTASIITPQDVDAVEGGYVVSFNTPGTSGYATYAIVRESNLVTDTTVGFATAQGGSLTTARGNDVAGLEDGTFVLTWEAVGSGGDLDILAARFDTSGTQVGATQVVNSVTAGQQYSPTVIGLDDGGFMVSWTSLVAGSSASNGIYGQRFDATGAKVGPQVRIDNIANGNEFAFLGDGMAQLADGSLITTWGANFGSATDVQYTRTELLRPVNGYEDTPLAIDVTAALSDLDGSETLTLTLDGFPAGATFNKGSAGPGGTWLIGNAEDEDLSTLAMTPPADWNGTFTLNATATSQEATNGDTASASASETYRIGAVNDAPEPGVTSATTTEDTPVTLDVLSAASDVDGDPVALDGFTQGANGTVDLDDQGDADPSNDRIVYTPDSDFFGSDSFTYTITDGEGGAVTQTVDVNVEPVNDLPTANDISGSITEGSQVSSGSAQPLISGPVTTDLTSYFLLEDGGLFIGGARTPGTTGTATEIHQTYGTFQDGYIVLMDSGVDTGGQSQFTAQAFALVGGVMTAVDATHWSASGYSGTVDTSGSVFTGTGADSNFDLRFEILDLPATNDRSVSYQLDARRLDLGSDAPDSLITRAVIEGERVTTVPPAPITLIANASDVEDVPGDLTFTVDDITTQGSVVNNGDGTFDYSPLAAFNHLGDGETALDTFNYTVTDADGGMASATPTIQITGRDPAFSDPFFEPAEAPILVDDLFSLTNTAGPESFDVLANDSDANNDPLTIVGVTQPSAGSVSISGNQLLFTPGAPFEGLDLGQTAQVSVDYSVTDGLFTETATATFDVTGDVAFDPGTQTATDTGTGLVGQALTLQVTGPERTNDGSADATVDVSIGDPVDGLIDVIFVIDRSGSTEFTGSSLIAGVGDQNGDLVADTVLDAEILAVSNLVDAIVAEGFSNGTVTLTLLPFSSSPSTALTVTLDASDDPSGGPSDAEVFKQSLSMLNGNGGTNYIPALEEAGATFDQLEVDNGAVSSSKYLYFVTDGDPADRLSDTEPDPFAPIRAVTDQLTADGVTMAAVGINANPNALRQDALDAVDNTGGGVFTTNFVDLDAALLAGAQPDAALIGADVFVFNSAGSQVGAQSFTDVSFSTSPFGRTLDLPGLSGLDSIYGDMNELLVQAHFDTDEDNVSDLTLETSLEIAGALPDAVLL